MWEVWQYCAAPLAVLQYEEAGRRYPGTGRTGHEYSSTDTWPYHSVSPCQVWQYGADFLMYPSIASHSSRTGYFIPSFPFPRKSVMGGEIEKWKEENGEPALEHLDLFSPLSLFL